MSMCMLVYLFNYTVVVSFRYCIERFIKLLDAKRTDMVQFHTFYEINNAEYLFVNTPLRINTFSNNK